MPSAWRRGGSTTSRSRAAASRCPRFSAARSRWASTAWPSSPRSSRRARCAALAISSAERLPGVDVPTLREQGVDVEFENWRSLVAPPGLTAAGPPAAGSARRCHGRLPVLARGARLATAGSIAIWPARPSCGSSTPKRRACETSCGSSERDGTTPDRRDVRGRTRCSSSAGLAFTAAGGRARRASRDRQARRRSRQPAPCRWRSWRPVPSCTSSWPSGRGS